MLRLPDWFEQALGTAAGINLASSRALEEITPAVEYLSKRFMRQEDALPKNYFSDETVRRAYLTYFFTTNLLKLSPVLDELNRSGFFTGRTSLRAIDIGTGVGTAAIGLHLWLSLRGGDTRHLKMLATDASPAACKEAEHTAACFREYLASPALHFRTLAAPMENLGAAKPGTFDIVIAQNVLVESPNFDELLSCANDLLENDSALLLIEPASRFGSRTLLTFRDRLVQAGYTIYAPCVRQADCPALKDPSDWCHAISRWERPKFIRILDDRIGNLRLSLKYSYIVALRKPLNIAATLADANGKPLYRVVSERIDEKGRKKFYGCGAGGRVLFEKQKRDTTETNKPFDSTERYDLVTIEGTEPKAAMQRVKKDGDVRIVKKFE